MEGSNSTSATITAVNNSNASAQEAVDVKVSFRNEIRRFQLEGAVNLASLRSKVRALFSIDERSSFVLLYRDEEDDFVTMNLDEEFKYALKISGAELLRLEVRLEGDAPVAKPNLEASPAAAEEGRCSRWEEKRWKKMSKHHHGGHFGHHGHPGQFSPFFGPRSHGPHAHGAHFMHSAPEAESFEGFGKGRGRRWSRPEQEGQAPDLMERGCKDKLKARHVKDITIPDGTVVLPGVPFIKTWRIRNAGSVDWPANTRLVFISHKGDHMGGPEFVPVEGVVKAETEINLSVSQVAPNEPGDYSGFWRLATEDGKKFGQRLWVSIKVVAESSSSSESSSFEHIAAPTEYEKLLQQVLDMGYTDIPKRRIQHLLYKFGGNVQTVVEKLEKRRGCHEKRAKRDGCERKKH